MVVEDAAVEGHCAGETGLVADLPGARDIGMGAELGRHLRVA